jgi:hypothetical protein
MKTLARQRDRDEILRRLRTIDPERAARWGRMSAHQMVCHLTDSFRAVLGQKPVSDASGPLSRTLVKWVALYAPFRWPPGIPTRPELDQSVGGTRPADFVADVEALEAFVTRVTPPQKDVPWQSHPIFGRMSRAAWLRWAYLHMDHHLRQFGA